MNREAIKQYYKNKIDDVKDEEVREKMFEKLEEIDDTLFILDCEIDEELEKQSSVIQKDSVLEDEFNYSCRMPM